MPQVYTTDTSRERFQQSEHSEQLTETQRDVHADTRARKQEQDHEQQQEQDSLPSEDRRFDRLSENRRREVVALLDIQQMALADYQRTEPIPGVLAR